MGNVLRASPNSFTSCHWTQKPPLPEKRSVSTSIDRRPKSSASRLGSKKLGSYRYRRVSLLMPYASHPTAASAMVRSRPAALPCPKSHDSVRVAAQFQGDPAAHGAARPSIPQNVRHTLTDWECPRKSRLWGFPSGGFRAARARATQIASCHRGSVLVSKDTRLLIRQTPSRPLAASAIQPSPNYPFADWFETAPSPFMGCRVRVTLARRRSRYFQARPARRFRRGPHRPVAAACPPRSPRPTGCRLKGYRRALA